MTFKRAFRLGLLASASLCAMAVPSSAAAISAGIAAASAFLASGTLAAAAANAVISAGLAYGSSLLSAALTKKPKAQGGTLIDVQFAADVYRSIPFGRVALGGRRIYWKGVGKKNGRICIVDALGDWACEGLAAVWVNGVRKTLNSITVVGTEDARYEVEDYDDKFVVKFFSGTMGQSADSELITLSADTDGGSIGAWTSDHRGAGVCYVSYILEYDDDLMPSEPRLLWELDGALLYDWRLDSTNGGTGSHRWDDPTTWEFSADPAVASYNYRRGFFRNGLRLGGIGVPSYDILHDAYTTAANICDETVSDGGGNRDRYVVSFISNDDAEHRVAIDTFNGAMAGDDIERGGQFGVLAGAAYSPVMTLTDDDMIEGEAWTYRDKFPINALYNAVHVSWLNPAQPWSSDTLTPLTDSGYETEDGGTRIARDIDLPMVPNAYQARAIGKIELEKSRMQASHSGTYVGKTMVLQPGDWVTRTFNRATSYGVSDLLDDEIYGVDMDFLTGFYLYRNGPDSLTMRVKSKRRVGAERYQIELEQSATATYTGPTGGITVPSAPTITRPNIDPDAPSGLTATGLPGAVLLKWTNPTADTFDQIEVWEASTNDRSGATLLGTQRSTSLLRSPLNAGTTRYYWIRALDLSSRVSAWHPTGSTSGVSGSAGSIAGADSSVFEVVASLPTLPDAGYPDGITVNLTPPGTLYSNIGGTWVQATPLLAVDELSALSARMGTLVAGVIESPNYVADKAGFRIDADTGSISAMDITVAGGTSTSRPFETRFGTIQDDVPSDEGVCSVNLPMTLTGGSYLDFTGTAKRTATGIEYDITASRTFSGDLFTGSLQGTLPRAKGIAWAPAVVKVMDPGDGAGDWYGFECTKDGLLYEFHADSAANTAPTRNLIASFLNTIDADPMFTAAYNQTTIHCWKDVLLRGVRRIRVPDTVLVTGTPTPVVGATFWLWGAAGQGTDENPGVGGGGPFAASRGGPGGYVKFSHTLEPNEILSLMVGGYDGNGFGGMSVIGSSNSDDDQNIGGQGGGGSFVWRGATARANLLGVAGGGGGSSAEKRNGSTNVGVNHGNPGGSSNGGGNGVSGSEMDVCIGQSYLHGNNWRGSGGGGYVGGGYLTATGNPGKGGTNFIIGTATSTTNSASAEDGNFCSTGTTPPGTAEAAYTANSSMTWSRANVGTSSATPGLAGPGMICIQWLV